MRINQILPALCYGDAVGNDAIAIRDLLKENGYESEIYAKYMHPKVSSLGKYLNTYKGDPSNILIYHFAAGGMDVTDFVKSLPDKMIIRYHNITPAFYFKNIDDTLEYLCSIGLKELRDLSNYSICGLGDSDFNSSQLSEYGFKNVTTLPIMIDLGQYDAYKPDASKDFNDGMTNFIFVGRIAPNKKQEDIERDKILGSLGWKVIRHQDS